MTKTGRVHYFVAANPGQTACESKTQTAHDDISKVTCKDCLNVLVNSYHHQEVADDELTPLMRMYKEGGAAIRNGGAILPTAGLDPFDIVLRVVPIGLDMPGTYDEAVVKFGIVGEHTSGYDGRMYFIDHDGEISVPVNKIRYYKENQ